MALSNVWLSFPFPFLLLCMKAIKLRESCNCPALPGQDPRLLFKLSLQHLGQAFEKEEGYSTTQHDFDKAKVTLSFVKKGEDACRHSGWKRTVKVKAEIRSVLILSICSLHSVCFSLFKHFRNIENGKMDRKLQRIATVLWYWILFLNVVIEECATCTMEGTALTVERK